MKTRVLTGIFIAAVAVALFCLSDTFIYPAVLAVISALAAFEVLRVLSLHKNVCVAILTYTVAASMPIAAYLLKRQTAPVMT